MLQTQIKAIQLSAIILSKILPTISYVRVSSRKRAILWRNNESTHQTGNIEIKEVCVLQK